MRYSGALEKNEGFLYELLTQVNITRRWLKKRSSCSKSMARWGRPMTIKLLYFRTPNPWQPDTERIERVLNLRRAELAQMQAYVDHNGCLMEFLQRALDDPNPQPCGRCANCQGKGFSTWSPRLVIEAENF